jgi:hypothetical protein
VAALLFEPDQLVELRCPIRPGRTVSGYYNNYEKLATDAAKLNGTVPGVYVTVNPVQTSLFARAVNRYKDFAKETTSDNQILRRRFFLLDIDPVRPSGISSSESEHQSAIDRAYQVKAWLEREFGFVWILIADSGNGAHLMIAVDLQNDDVTIELFKRCIEAVALRFEDAAMGFDRTVYNAARIWKVYGTLGCKGDSTAERPHRYSKILEAPERPWTATPIEAFKRLADTIPEEPRSKEKGRSQFDLAKWIADNNLDVIGPHPWNNGQKWIFRTCPWNAEHANRSAYIVLFASGAISTGCHHNSCAGKHWHELRDVVEPGWRDHKASEHANSYADWTEESSDQQDARVIDVTDQDLPRLTQAAWDALLAMNNPPVIFRHGNYPARIERDDRDSPMIRVMEVDRMRHRLARVACWRKRKGKRNALKSVTPPLDVVRDVIATPDMPLPVITHIVEIPVYAADGTLQIEPGYHPRTQNYYSPAPGFVIPAVPELPSSADVKRARELITEDLLGDFPFTGEAEKTHAVGLQVLPSVRNLIEGPTPLHLIEKPAPGTGASLLTDVISCVTTGQVAPVMTEGRDEDEWRKRITAKLRGGPAIILIDNLSRRLDSAALSAAITSLVWEDRILGYSEDTRIPVRCAWVATGNNPTVSSEIARRVVRIRLDAKRDRPWERDAESFRHPELRLWVAENRAELVWAALTLVQTWLAAGKPVPKDLPTLGGFEQWARVIGGILEVSGIKGFLENRSEFYEASDAEGKIWRKFVGAWWERFKEQCVGVSQLFEVEKLLDEPFELGDKGEQSQKIRLGKLLAKARDRQFAIVVDNKPMNLRIVSAEDRNHAAQWQLKVGDPWDA